MGKYLDLTGHRYGRLVALTKVGRVVYLGGGRKTVWRCRCDCGSEVSIKLPDLRGGRTKSCGCLSSARFRTHGLSKRPEFRIFCGMLSRCYNPNRKGYRLYGGRGIAVCDRWRNGEAGKTGFEYFLADLGPRPSKKHSLDRIDNNGNYEPSNCRWATRIEQCINRRCTRYVVYRGQKMGLTEAVRAAGNIIHYETAAIRIFRCRWTVERAVETPSSRPRP